MDNLAQKLGRACIGAEFDLRVRKAKSVEIPEMLNSKDRSIWRALLGSAKVRVEERKRREVERELEIRLEELIDNRTKMIGNGLYHLTGGPWNPTIGELVDATIRASAAIGEVRVSEIIQGWSKGEPIQFNRMMVLNGVKVEKEIREIAGINIKTLPKNINQLPEYLQSLRDFMTSEVLGKTLLSIEYESSHGLYKIEDGMEGSPKPRKRSKIREMGDLTSESLCKALAIACNSYVGKLAEWDDLTELKSFFGGGMHISYSTLDIGAFLTEKEISTQDVKEMMIIHKNIEKVQQKKSEIEIAINRWIRSKNAASYEDRLIDLRIAIEALFRKGNQGEIALRASTFGAFYLGKNNKERREIAKIIREAYEKASTIVHGRKIKDSQREILNREIIRAQDVCREGILRRIEAEGEQTWEEVVFGENKIDSK